MGSVTLGLLILLNWLGVEAIRYGIPPTTAKAPYPRYRNHQSFLPAPPGITPACARHGETFCEHVTPYPSDTIQSLLSKRGPTYSLFIKSETPQEYPWRVPPHSYYPESFGGYDDTPFPNSNSSYFGKSTQTFASSSALLPQQLAPYVPPPHQVAAVIVPFLHSFWWDSEQRRRRKASAYHHNQRHQIQKRQASDIQLCSSTSRFITPEAAMNNEGDWMYIVNMPNDPRYAQQVRIETCADDGSQCNGICQVPPRHRATCRQKYTQKRLVALDGSGTVLRNGVFWIPLCCSCEIERV